MSETGDLERLWREIDRLREKQEALLEDQIALKAERTDPPSIEKIAEEVKPFLRADVEGAWELQTSRLPGMIREELKSYDAEKADARKKALEEMGYEIGPDGAPRKKGGAFNAFIKQHAVTVIIVLLAVLVSNHASLALLFRLGWSALQSL